MTKVKLSEVIRRCQTKVDRCDTDLLYYVAGEHFESGEIDLAGRGEIAGSTIGPMFYYGFKPGDFLLVSRNPHLRKASRVDFAGICSEKTFVLETADEGVLLSEYLPWVLQNDRFWGYAQENRHGSTNFFINWSTLADYEFELPPIENQKRIAAILWAAQSVRRNYRKLLTACDDVVKSQFVEMFGGPEVFEAAPNTVKDVAKLRVGIVIKPSRFYAAAGTGTPAFRSLNIGPMRIQNSDWIEFTDEAMRANTRTVAHEGDVLIVRSGYPGTSCVVTAEFAGRNVVDLIIATPDRDKVLPEYLCAYLNCPPGKSQIERMQHGVAQQHFNVGMCEKLRLRIPPLSHQKEFADFAAQVDKSKFAVQRALDELNATTKKILNQELGLGDV